MLPGRGQVQDHVTWLWPVHTAQTFIDVWSVVHLCFWVVFGANVEAIFLARRLQTRLAYLLAAGVALLLACVWEVVEWQLVEPRGLALHLESTLNRWVSDPMMAMIGMMGGIHLVRKQ